MIEQKHEIVVQIEIFDEFIMESIEKVKKHVLAGGTPRIGRRMDLKGSNEKRINLSDDIFGNNEINRSKKRKKQTKRNKKK